MPLKATGYDVVVAGKFNPFIIQPPWLSEQGLLSAEDVKVSFQVDSSGRGAGLSFSAGPLTWTVTNSRLTLSATTNQADTWKSVVEVLQKLPHTPISAVGHNAHFTCDAQEWTFGPPTVGGKLGSELQFGEPDIEYQSSRWVGTYLRKDPAGEKRHNLMFDIEFESQEITLHVNFHRNVKNAQEAISALEFIESDRTALPSLLSSALGMTLA